MIFATLQAEKATTEAICDKVVFDDLTKEQQDKNVEEQDDKH